MKKHVSRFVFITFTLFLAAPVFSGTDDVRIQGFLSQGYLQTSNNNFYGDTEDGTFQFNEMGINFTSILNDKLHVGLQLFARDFGRYGNDQIDLSWAYGDYKYQHFLGIRAGLMKLSYGLYNEVRDLDFLRPNILYPIGMYNESWRDLLSSIKGIGFYGNFQLWRLGKLKYNIQGGTVNILTDSAISGSMETIMKDVYLVMAPEFARNMDVKVTDISVDHNCAGSVFIDSLFSVDGLKGGISYLNLKYQYKLNYSFPENYPIKDYDLAHQIKIDSLIYSLEYTINDLTIAGEYKLLTAKGVIKQTDFKIEKPGITYYGSISYSFTEWLEAYACYSKYYEDKDHKSGENYRLLGQKYRGWLEEIILAVRFDINDNWILKLETHINDGAASLFNEDQGDLEAYGTGRYRYPYHRRWELYAVKFSYHF